MSWNPPTNRAPPPNTVANSASPAFTKSGPTFQYAKAQLATISVPTMPGTSAKTANSRYLSSPLLLRGLAGFFAFRGFFGLRLVAFLARAAAALARTAAAAAGFAEGLAQHSKESLFRLLFV